MARLKTIALVATGASIVSATVAWATETITYTYDAKGRLVAATHSGSVNNNVMVNYAFDPADNRTNVNVIGAP